MFNSTYGTMYYVDDMNKSVAHYKKLGFKATEESEHWTEFDVGGHKLCLHSKIPGEKYQEGGILIINQNGVKALREKMNADRVGVSELKEIHPGFWNFHMKDLTGNQISIVGPL